MEIELLLAPLTLQLLPLPPGVSQGGRRVNSFSKKLFPTPNSESAQMGF